MSFELSVAVTANHAGREAVPAPYSQPFIEALLSMVGALVTSTSGERRMWPLHLMGGWLMLCERKAVRCAQHCVHVPIL